MNKLFPITALLKGKFIVSWPDWDNIKRFDTKKLEKETLRDGFTEGRFDFNLFHI